MTTLENVHIREIVETDLSEMDTHGDLPGVKDCDHKELLGDADYCGFLALHNEILCGHVYVRWSGFSRPRFASAFPDACLIHKLAVWPAEQRNNGIGTALVDVCEQAARDRGRTQIGLGVYADNTRGIRFYEKLGYASWNTAGVPDGNPKHPLGLIAMTKEL